MTTADQNPTPPESTEASEAAALEAFEQHALSQGVLLKGEMNRFATGYNVVACRADTGEPLYLGFLVTLHMANHPAEFRAALEKLLAEALAALVRK